MKQEELNPSSSTQTAWKVGSGSAGTAAGKGVSAAAKLSLTAGQEIVKVRATRHTSTLPDVLACKFTCRDACNVLKRLCMLCDGVGESIVDYQACIDEQAAVPASKWALSQGLALAWKLASGAGKNAQKRKQSD